MISYIWQIDTNLTRELSTIFFAAHFSWDTRGWRTRPPVCWRWWHFRLGIAASISISMYIYISIYIYIYIYISIYIYLYIYIYIYISIYIYLYIYIYIYIYISIWGIAMSWHFWNVLKFCGLQWTEELCHLDFPREWWMRCCLLCHMRLPWEGALDCLIACSTGVQDMNLFMDSNDLYDLFPGDWTSNLSIYCITGLKHIKTPNPSNCWGMWLQCTSFWCKGLSCS